MPPGVLPIKINQPNLPYQPPVYSKSLDLNIGPLPKFKENVSKQGHGGQTKTLQIERSSALDLWGDLDGFQTVKRSSNHMCVCIRDSDGSHLFPVAETACRLCVCVSCSAPGRKEVVRGG